VGLTAVTAEEKTRWAKAPDGTRGFTPGHRSTEKHSMEELRSATIEAEERRKRRAIQAPAGFVYSGHSCRAGSLSEASALGVPIVRLRFVGGYAVGSRVPEDKYIDPTCPPSPAGAFFFGWLQPPRSTFVDFSFGNVDSIINPSEPSASRREQPARQV
jgi:hypothetical protein